MGCFFYENIANMNMRMSHFKRILFYINLDKLTILQALRVHFSFTNHKMSLCPDG